MKKILTTLVIVIGFYNLSFAQQRFGEQEAGNTEFGLDVGYNSAYLLESQSAHSSDFVSGFNVGISSDYYFSKAWSLKVKVIYDQKGWGNGYITTNGDILYSDVNFKLNYVTVPVMANWHFGRTRNWYLNFGPYIGFLTSAKETTDNIDVKDSFNSVDGGIALGVGIKIPISDNAKFFIEYDGQGGVVNVFKQADGTYQNIRGSFNIGINFQ